MIISVAPDLTRNWPQKRIKLMVPGGWRLELPEIQVDDDYKRKSVLYYVRKEGSIRGSASAQDMVQTTGVVGFRESLFASIFYYAKLYCRLYPERLVPVRFHKNTFQLLGYDPEVIQRLHVPDRYPGREGIQAVKTALMEMGGGNG